MFVSFASNLSELLVLLDEGNRKNNKITTKTQFFFNLGLGFGHNLWPFWFPLSRRTNGVDKYFSRNKDESTVYKKILNKDKKIQVVF